MGKKDAVFLPIACGLFLGCFGQATGATPSARGPALTLWAWERQEDLSWVEPSSVDVAVLLATFIGHSGEMSIAYRRHSLRAPKEAVTTAVFRIEGFPESSPTSTRTILDTIREVLAQRSFSAVQIDFDARVSQRDWYKRLITDLRRELPHRVRLEITALASWCREATDWLSIMPVDAVVPMFFRMGKEGTDIKARLVSSPLPAVCESVIGVSRDERVEIPKNAKRVFVFSPKPWRKESGPFESSSIFTN